MTRIRSDLPAAELMMLLEKYTDLRRAALLADDVPRANRYSDKVHAVLNALTDRGEEGRRAFEELLTHPLPHMRLYAAGKAIKWKPDAAVPVLGRLLIEEFDDGTARLAAVDVRVSADNLLMEFFDIKSLNPNDLIEPIKAYGIDLPRMP
ncbi:DUF2019 domain-containing protein [Mesorhizobium sp. RMAD-H1]|uniref:DUF2019 domain-containing protein n=1 Tax=Mesorhizobium sp. RMAD-H1 TaxID=2587065 RepID=UPI00161B3C46|nr:DUF2019 domain-containing protein [Mesorhizobium sp. RMAD-H1]MBB2970188.1 hypothetical protein [Mesorhizobium sp. RMAD-H1]